MEDREDYGDEDGNNPVEDSLEEGRSSSSNREVK